MSGNPLKRLEALGQSVWLDYIRRLIEEDGLRGMTSNPSLFEKAIADTHDYDEARRLWAALNRPNVFIKVPATAEGVPAIRQLIGEGVEKFNQPFDKLMETLVPRI